MCISGYGLMEGTNQMVCCLTFINYFLVLKNIIIFTILNYNLIKFIILCNVK